MTGDDGTPGPDDADLVRRLAAGDETALVTLYRCFATTVHGVAHRVTGERGAAEEVVQQVFLHAWTNARDFDPARAGLRGWLAMLAHRRAVDWVRRESTRRRAAPEVEDVPVDVEDLAIASAVAAQVQAAVARLPEHHRGPIRMLYFDDLSVREIAERLGVPEGTAKTRLRTARLRLAEQLETEGLVAAE